MAKEPSMKGGTSPDKYEQSVCSPDSLANRVWQIFTARVCASLALASLVPRGEVKVRGHCVHVAVDELQRRAFFLNDDHRVQ